MQRLPLEQGRMHEEVARLLRLLTGVDMGRVQERWLRWWADQPEGWSPPTLAEALAAEAQRGPREGDRTTRSTFYGLPVVSERVCFLVDVSGSMNEVMKSAVGGTSTTGEKTGTKRIDVAREQLGKALQGLDPGQLFNVLFFATDVFPWQDELVPCNAETQVEALDFVRAQKVGGGTATYDALARALEDEAVDTIYLLSDGVPSGGTFNDIDRILEEIAILNGSRRVMIHGIAVGAASRLLKGLADESGGAYREFK
jgi:hypothetical protein